LKCRKGLLRHNVAGKGSRDDTPNGRTQFAPTAHGLPFCPYGRIPYPPQTFRREQAPALRLAVYLFAYGSDYRNVGTPLPGRPEKVSLGTMSPGKVAGMIRQTGERSSPLRCTAYLSARRGGFRILPKGFGGSKPPPYGSLSDPHGAADKIQILHRRFSINKARPFSVKPHFS